MNTKVLEKILNDKNIPTTAMRLLVLQQFQNSKSAISLAELEQKLYPADRSTIYRTLKTFEKKGLIHSIKENNSSQYLLCHEACDEEQHQDFHLHFFCNQCKKTTCLENVYVDNLELPKGFCINELKFVASGICPDCQKTMQ